MEQRKRISVVVPCFNEEENVGPMYEALRKVFSGLDKYNFEIIFIDNCSTDGTVAILKQLAASDPDVKVILNARNFGTVRSHFYGILQTSGNAAVTQAADFQEPPELIPELIAQWEKGFKIVIAVKKGAEESPFMQFVRKIYYAALSKIADVDLVQNFNGACLIDRQVVEIARNMDDPYPYFRGMLAEIGLPRAEVPYVQKLRRAGKTKNNFFTLYDVAMTGVTSHSKAPLRLITFVGFLMSGICFLIAAGYMFYKLIMWESFQMGMAPLIIGQFFVNGIILTILGLSFEYIGSINMRLLKRPLVIEKERLNFEKNSTDSAK
ncbi:MAG: glycosyltransferase family 2 protein [Magnetococcales bacterium]|nr:glycosyltransferase family 2 protein [Magnetococcales bacterium]MBF0321900.1 glycosyltransferase family 2 protein [Magnetococcales bacterium]